MRAFKRLLRKLHILFNLFNLEFSLLGTVMVVCWTGNTYIPGMVLILIVCARAPTKRRSYMTYLLENEL